MRTAALKRKDDSITIGIQNTRETVADTANRNIAKDNDKNKRNIFLTSRHFLWLIAFVLVYIFLFYSGIDSMPNIESLQTSDEKESLYSGDEISYPSITRNKQNKETGTNKENDEINEHINSKKVEIYNSVFESIPVPDNNFFKGRGIVIAASGQYLRHLVGAYVTAHNIRTVWKSNLPIEIFYSGEGENFSVFYSKYFKNLGNVQLIDLDKSVKKLGSILEKGENDENGRHPYSRSYLFPTVKMLKGYASKPYAMYASSFREAIVFDAGVVVFQPPEVFFDIEGYKKDGFLLFRDYVSMFDGPEKVRWQIVSCFLFFLFSFFLIFYSLSISVLFTIIIYITKEKTYRQSYI